VTVSRETIRQWVNCFGRHFAACIRRGGNTGCGGQRMCA
jgi:hypothetical protein